MKMRNPIRKACQVFDLPARFGKADVSPQPAGTITVANETGRDLHARVSVEPETGVLFIVIGHGAGVPRPERPESPPGGEAA